MSFRKPQPRPNALEDSGTCTVVTTLRIIATIFYLLCTLYCNIMKSIVFIFLFLWGIVYGWDLDGKIQNGEYTSNQELINTGNSTW